MKSLLVVVFLALLSLASLAQADVLGMGPGLTSLETVTIGAAGNPSDARTGYGSVSYSYGIGKYEVTAAQYTEFLNVRAKSDPYGLYNPWMWSDPYGYSCKIARSGDAGSYTYNVASEWANRPVNYVNFWDACRFANWLNNGQGDGDTETGAYTLEGYTDADGHLIKRNSGAKWFVPSEDEWYKAAYYTGGTGMDYWEYATQSNAKPSNQVVAADPGNNANYYVGSYSIGNPYFRTNVGEFENSESTYGTFDQTGNVYEWNDTVYDGPAHNFFRAGRGGGFNAPYPYISASYRAGSEASWEDGNIGFRVATAVAEPPPVAALAAGFGLLLAIGRRRY